MFKDKLLLAQSPRTPPSLPIYFTHSKGLQITNPGPLTNSSNIQKYSLTAKKKRKKKSFSASFSPYKFSNSQSWKGSNLTYDSTSPSKSITNCKGFQISYLGPHQCSQIIGNTPPRKPHFFLLGFEWLYSLVLVGQIAIAFTIVPSSRSHSLQGTTDHTHGVPGAALSAFK